MDTGLRRYDDKNIISLPKKSCPPHSHSRHPDIRAPQNFNFVGDTRSETKENRHPDAGREPLCSVLV